MAQRSYGFDITVPNLPSFIQEQYKKFAPLAYPYGPSKEIIALLKEALQFRAYSIIATQQLKAKGSSADLGRTIEELKARSENAMKAASRMLGKAPVQYREPIVRMGELVFLQTASSSINTILSVEPELAYFGVRRDPQGFVAYEKKTYHPPAQSRPTVANGTISSVPADPTYTSIWDDEAVSTSQSSSLPQGETTGDEIAFQTTPSTATPSLSTTEPLPSLSTGPGLHQTSEIFADQGLTPSSYDEGTADSAEIDQILADAEIDDSGLYELSPQPVTYPFYKKPLFWGLAVIAVGGGYYYYQRNQ